MTKIGSYVRILVPILIDTAVWKKKKRNKSHRTGAVGNRNTKNAVKTKLGEKENRARAQSGTGNPVKGASSSEHNRPDGNRHPEETRRHGVSEARRRNRNGLAVKPNKT